MKILKLLTGAEKIMMIILIVVTVLLSLFSYSEKSKYGSFIDSLQNCSEETHIHQQSESTSPNYK